MITGHQPILLEEAIAGLAIKPNGIYIDATFGRGGHSAAILQGLNSHGRLLAIDKDPQAIAWAKQRFAYDPRLQIFAGSFNQLQQIAIEQKVVGHVSGILLDLGVSSPQLDDPTRGFSFMQDGFLDMRMDTTIGMTAATWINSASAEEISDVLNKYGEERYAKRIAKAIVAARNEKPISTTAYLADVIKRANPRWEMHKHPATRSFQAIRIFINHELEDLKMCLEQCLEVLAVGGRLAVISFHSLEDRIVKRFIRQHAERDASLAKLPVEPPVILRLRRFGKAIKPSATEIAENPRARSAILRLAEKLL